MKKLACSLLSSTMALLMTCNSVFAVNESTQAGDSIGSSVSLDHDAIAFSVAIPIGLPVTVSGDGTVVTASDASIVNNGVAGVVVTDVSVSGVGSWELVDFDTDFNRVLADQKKFGFQLQTENVALDGSVGLARNNWPVIFGGDSMALNYNATLPAQTSVVNMNIAEVVFTVDFWTDGDSGGTGPVVPASAVSVAKVNLTSEQADGVWLWTDNGNNTATITKYIWQTDGAQAVTVPYTIDGKRVASVVANAFSGDARYKGSTLDVPEGVTLERTSIAFSFDTVNIADGCTLESGTFSSFSGDMNIGNGVQFNYTDGSVITSNSSVMNNLFIDSDVPDRMFVGSNINNITLSDKVRSVGEMAFSNNSMYRSPYKSIKGLENVRNFGERAFASVSSDPTDGVIGADLVIRADSTFGKKPFTKILFNSIIVEDGVSIPDQSSAMFDLVTVGTFTLEGNNSIGRDLVSNSGTVSWDTVIIGDNCTIARTALRRLEIKDLRIGKNVDLTSDFSPFYLGIITNLYIDSASVSENAFASVKIKNLEFSANVETIGVGAFSTLGESHGRSSIQSIVGLESIKTISNNAFNYSIGNAGLDLVIADDATVGSNAFANCTINSASVGATTTYEANSFPAGKVTVRQ